MARYWNARRARPARLTVVPMRGWRRSMTWVDTGRPWTPPSPNLRSAEAALAYPGVALLEATNLSEGRGTDAPFLLFGAPWLEAGELAQVPGFQFAPARFTPKASAAAPQPKHLDLECRGWRVGVTRPRETQSYRLGVTLLAALAARPGFEWIREGRALTWLVGSPRLFEQLRAGVPVDEIVAADGPDHAAWRRERAAALLYE
jgi:uncharacterized protein YbbC (DUF1343 family)